jgi:hypothetical protein
VTIKIRITPVNPPITPTYKSLDDDSVIAEIKLKTKHNTLSEQFLNPTLNS